MESRRAPEDRSWDPPADLDLTDDATVRYWTRRLEVTRAELEEVVERVSLHHHVQAEHAQA